MAEPGDIAIGIDLGTSYSCVSIIENGKPMVIPNEWGERTHASVVSFLEDGTVLVGNSAKRNIITNADNTVYSAKRLIGRFFFSDEVKKAQAVMPYKIIEGENNSVRIQIRENVYSLPEISALVLKEMKSIVENYLGHEVKKAVVTVPAYFNDNQRQATKDAGRVAGLEVLRILNEPTAAALSYGFGKDITQKIAVYDLGGGTFDISILEIGKDVFEVLSTAGDTYLGGDDFDDRIMTWLAEDLLQKSRLDLRQNKYCLRMLKEASEQAKIDVGTHGVANILCQGICQDANGKVGGFTEKIIEKNTPIPIDKSKTFTTSRDGQDRVKIRVYQGESNKADECEMLGEFEFTGFKIGYRGEVKIEVTFEIDTNGIVNVSATDVESGQRTSTTISLSSGLSEGDIQKSIEANKSTQLARGA